MNRVTARYASYLSLAPDGVVCVFFGQRRPEWVNKGQLPCSPRPRERKWRLAAIQTPGGLDR